MIEQQIELMKTNFPRIYKSMLVDRNNNWLSQIEEFFATEEIEFVVFGALHLYRKEVVLHLLKQKGYQVELAKF